MTVKQTTPITEHQTVFSMEAGNMTKFEAGCSFTSSKDTHKPCQQAATGKPVFPLLILRNVFALKGEGAQ
jgi:hypothetical protein